MSDQIPDLHPFLAENQANWNSRVPVHLGPGGYRVEQFIEDRTKISDVVNFDRPKLGDLTGRSVVHLQCHIGTDTISLARLGASEVVGVDFSDKALNAARKLATDTSDNARFVLSDVYHAAATVNQQFDLLYTSVGTICWFDDIERWASNVAGLLKPGGRFVFRDLHPIMWVFEELDGEIVPHFPYWQRQDEPLRLDENESYLGVGTISSTRTNGWNHTVGEVLNALIASGMGIDHVDEHAGCDWQLFPSAIAEGTQHFLPDNLRNKLPVCWSITATKK